MAKVFIGGFPLDANELQIVQLVSLHGQVDTIKIVRDKKTRICKGYAFLEMKDKAAADAVIDALDGTMMGDRVLSVAIAPDVPPAKPSRPSNNGSFRKPFNKSAAPYGNSSSTGDRPRRPRK
ncbi:hypothetical protein GCM10023149_02150 [Mucilaginibacter gynuensis]|uniref:RRM domain-containing protein n=1 Tax=Mucilaginibacter gynuensis TaxID=1302236 RepID=A0ABP8FPL8_9SPHI